MSSFKGEFIRSTSRRLGLPIVSFILTNKNWFQDETIRILISDVSGEKQRTMTLETQNGKTYTFNVDTMGWDWAQYDTFSILKKNGKVIQQWQCRMGEHASGDCSYCHGTKKCPACNGEGYRLSANYQIQMCSVCGGTGICQHCYVPERKSSLSGISSNNSFNSGYNTNRKKRSIATIQSEIRKTEFELARVNRMLLEYELRQDYGTFYASQQQYALSLEHKIKDLYDEMSRSI